MYYDFVCKNCGNKEIIEMKITEYTSEGYTCSKCQSALERDISSMKYGMVKDMSGGFYKQVF